LYRHQVRVNNVWPYRPPDNRDPLPEEIEAGTPALMQDIHESGAKYIIAVGRFAVGVFRGVYGDEIKMDHEHGVPFRWGDKVVIPVYHPAAGMHSKRMLKRVFWDWRRVRDVLGGWWFDSEPTTHYGPLDMARDDRFSNTKIAVDTETVQDKPWMIQASILENNAQYCMVDNPMDQPVMKEWLEYSGKVVAHNAMFDLDILDQCGIHPSEFTDTMLMAYLLGDEHQGLKDLAYKYFGYEMQTYQQAILPSTRRRAKEYLTKISNSTATKVRVFRTKTGKTGSWALFKKEQGIKPLTEDFEKITHTDEDTGKKVTEWQVTWETSLIPDPPRYQKNENMTLKWVQPTNIVKRVRKLLKDMDENETVDPVDRWKKMGDKDEAVQKFGDMPEGSLDDIPFEDAVQYGCADPDYTLRIHRPLMQRIREEGLEDTLRADCAAIPFLIDMQRAGMRVDRDALVTFGDELDIRMRDLDFRIQQELLDADAITVDQVFNENSHVQVRTMLNHWNVQPDTTDVKELEQYTKAVPWLRDHIEYKHLDKLKGTYVDGLLSKIRNDGRIYAKFNNNVADTGRLSSSNPNFQNIPTRTADGLRIRKVFVPAPDCWLLSLDYKQIEPRLMAHYSQDPAMLEIYRTGKDPYTTTASLIYGVPADQVDKKTQRDPMKAVYLGTAYLLSAFGLYNDLASKGVVKTDGSPYTEDECQGLLNEFYRVYPTFKEWQDAQLRKATETGKSWDLFGRFRLVPGAMTSVKKLRSEALRDAANNPMQSGAGGIMKRAMARMTPLYQAFAKTSGKICRPVNQIHDEFMFEVHVDLLETWMKTACSIMENVVQLSVPLGVDAEGSPVSWGDQEELGDWQEFTLAGWEAKQ